ncbi:thiamine kinase [Legionella massiliensis]|uniref:Thiamine kinase n=1 Tax=Legionella massiliensis TaxID=1034943 RepID=A0A078KWT0_9GAMM|nr:aminoglycoside phosphotransferase family protein [Legionella massiliensis]CDZ76224.1 thiamine kinase [Legionella massiliensis]CEE11962.1 Phosphotransferase enzyme family protein [Legionella massiliensis]
MLNSFLLKADIQIDDSVLQSLAALREQQVASDEADVQKIAHQLFGLSPKSCEVLSGGGTFHVIYKIEYESRKLILKTLVNIPGNTNLGLTKQFYLHRVLERNNIRAPKVFALNTEKSLDIPNYLAMEYVDGLSYESLADSPEFNTVAEKLGRTVALYHQIPTEGCGQILPQENSDKLQTIDGTWKSFLLSQLETHLEICEQNSYLSGADCKFSATIINELADEIKLDQPAMLHCDLGSKNIILTPENELCIIDWEDAIGGDPIFDIAMWGSFMQNQGKLNYFLKGYYPDDERPSDFYLRYFLYSYRILLAKTVHRYRFQYCRSDKIPPAKRLSEALEQLKEVMV